MADKNQAVYGGRPFWCGSVNLLDGQIEEVHSYGEAQAMDFHHSLYFSEAQVEKMAAGECAFFWINDGRVEIDWEDRDSEATMFHARDGRVEIIRRDYFIEEQLAEQVCFDDCPAPLPAQTLCMK